MEVDINKLKIFIHDLGKASPETVINAVVVSPEMKEILLRMNRSDPDEMANHFFGVKIYAHKYLGDLMIYGNEEKLIEAGFIQKEDEVEKICDQIKKYG